MLSSSRLRNRLHTSNTMDPNQAFNRIRLAVISGDTIQAIDSAIDLAAWLNGGGFYPSLSTVDDTMRLTQDEVRARVWSILGFFLDLDPNDELRNRLEASR